MYGTDATIVGQFKDKIEQTSEEKK